VELYFVPHPFKTWEGHIPFMLLTSATTKYGFDFIFSASLIFDRKKSNKLVFDTAKRKGKYSLG